MSSVALSKLQHVPFDSDALQMRVGRVMYEGGFDLPAIKSQVYDFDYVTAKVPAGDIGAVHALENIGFRLLGQTLDYRFDTHWSIPEFECSVVIRAFGPDDADAMGEIARHGFTHDRLHTDRDAIQSQRADWFYELWARNAATGKVGSGGLVAELDGKVAGFMTWAEIDPREERAAAPYARLGILAIRRTHVPGIGRKLIRETMAALKHRGNLWAEAGTEAANVQSITAYGSLGWKFTRAHTLLRWAR